MPASAFTAISSFQVIFFCKNNKPFRAQVIIIRLQILSEHDTKIQHCLRKGEEILTFEGMKKRFFYWYAAAFFFCHFSLCSQDSLQKTRLNIERDSTALFGCMSFVGSDSSRLEFGGYISTYYAFYTDEITNNGFVQIPVMAARNQQFGLNIAQISFNYISKNVRGKLGLHYGDIPKAIWPAELNMIQEAHGGLKFLKKFWFDAGIFRSHIGVESIQPRENITSSTSLVNNFEPYYFAGVKLTYEINQKLSLQLNAFNSFNTLVDYNKDKLFGLSLVYNPNDKVSVTYNFLTGDETPDSLKLIRRRYYNNVYATINIRRFTFALEGNYGFQENSMIKDTAGTATVYSGLATLKFQYVKRSYLYVRGEYLSDPDAVVTGNLNFGQYVMGTTAGLEYKPYRNISLSVEGRILQSDKQLFKENNYMTNQRLEGILTLDVSF